MLISPWCILGKAYNAVFTWHGRLNVRNQWRMALLNLHREFRGGNPVVYRLRSGKHFVVHPDDDLSLGIYLDREHDPLETRILLAYLREGDAVADAGANTGYYTAVFAQCVGRTGNVNAFEPGVATFAKLRKTVELLRLENVRLNNFALGDSERDATFFVSTTGKDAQQSLHHWSGGDTRSEAIKVKVRRLDEAFSERHFAVIKIDTEGADVEVLRGCSGLLRGDSLPLVMMEHNAEAMAAAGATIQSVREMLEGYRIYVISAETREAFWLEEKEHLPKVCNLVALPVRGPNASRLSSDDLVRLCRR